MSHYDQKQPDDFIPDPNKNLFDQIFVASAKRSRKFRQQVIFSILIVFGITISILISPKLFSKAIPATSSYDIEQDLQEANLFFTQPQILDSTTLFVFADNSLN